jgi:hypothetical protein
MPYSEKIEHKLDDEVIESVDSEETTEAVTVTIDETSIETEKANKSEKEKTEAIPSTNSKWIIVSAAVLAIVIAGFQFYS